MHIKITNWAYINYVASANEKKKNMAIYITNQQIKVTDEWRDSDGRYIVLKFGFSMAISVP